MAKFSHLEAARYWLKEARLNPFTSTEDSVQNMLAHIQAGNLTLSELDTTGKKIAKLLRNHYLQMAKEYWQQAVRCRRGNSAPDMFFDYIRYMDESLEKGDLSRDDLGIPRRTMNTLLRYGYLAAAKEWLESAKSESHTFGCADFIRKMDVCLALARKSRQAIGITDAAVNKLLKIHRR